LFILFISLTLGIERDLSFYGDDDDEFIYYYGEKFDVDISNFNFRLYFTPENQMLYLLIKILPCLNPKKKELTICNLIEGIKAGRLDEEVINASKEIESNR
jgi:hypothetical protein